MEMGLTESTMLLWSVVLGLVQIVIASVASFCLLLFFYQK